MQICQMSHACQTAMCPEKRQARPLVALTHPRIRASDDPVDCAAGPDYIRVVSTSAQDLEQITENQHAKLRIVWDADSVPYTDAVLLALLGETGDAQVWYTETTSCGHAHVLGSSTRLSVFPSRLLATVALQSAVPLGLRNPGERMRNPGEMARVMVQPTS